MSRLAVLLAAYNGEAYIGQQLDSLFAQTCQDFTLYIHDDGSTDGTAAVIGHYMQRYPGRISLLEYEPQGSARDNFFSLMQRIEAEYYMFCDEDDCWMQEKIQLSMEHMEVLEGTEPQVPCLVFSDLAVTDAGLNILHPSYLQYRGKNPKDLSVKALLVENVAAGCTMLCNRALVRQALRYKDRGHLFMHDWWLMLVAAALGRIAWVEKPLVLYRQHGSNTVGASQGSFSWLWKKIKNTLEGRQLAASKEGIVVQRTMAAELAAIVKLAEKEEGMAPACTTEERMLLQELAEIGAKPRKQRMCFYRKHGLLKQDWKNKWKLLLV